MPMIKFYPSCSIFQVDCKIERIETPCSKTCVDHGSRPTKTITSRIVQQPSFDGRPCPRVSRIERECFAPPCPPPGKFSSDSIDSFQNDHWISNTCLICDWDWFITLQIVGIKQTASHAAAADITYHQNASKKSWALVWFLSIRHTTRSTWLKA